MEWTIPKLIAGLAAISFLVPVYAYLLAIHRNRALWFWTFGWCCYLARHALMFWLPLRQEVSPVPVLYGTLAVVGCVLLLKGTCHFVERAFPRWAIPALLAGFVWVFLGRGLGAPFWFNTLLGSLVVALIYALNGLFLLQSPSLARAARWCTGGAFCLWGLVQASYPFSAQQAGFVPWGLLVAACLEVWTAIGILLLFMLESRKEMIAQQQSLESALKDREVLLREIHHRVKNNLQGITNLLELQCLQARTTSAGQALSECRDRVQAISLVHQHLSAGDDLTQVALGPFAAKLTASLLRSHGINDGEVALELDAAGVSLNMDQAITNGIILNELFTNTLQHGRPSESLCRVVYRARLNGRGEAEIYFADNGPGLPPDFDLEASQSLGLGLVRSLVERQLGGSLELPPHSGTAFRFRFPLQGTQPNP